MGISTQREREDQIETQKGGTKKKIEWTRTDKNNVISTRGRTLSFVFIKRVVCVCVCVCRKCLMKGVKAACEAES